MKTHWKVPKEGALGRRTRTFADLPGKQARSFRRCLTIYHGADGLIVEVHPHPELALSDGGQSLKPERYAELVRQTRAIAQAVGRSVAVRSTVTSTSA